MNKIARTLLSTLAVLTILLVPSTVSAQDAIIIDPNTDPFSESTELPSTGADETPVAPDTGIAPPDSKLAQNILVFTGGSMLGIALGFGVITFKKKQTEK